LPADNSFEARQLMQKHLQHARLRPIGAFHLGVAEGMSFDERRSRVSDALCQKLGYPNGGYGSYPMSVSSPYIPENGLGDDWVVYCLGGKYYGWSYDIDESTGQVTFTGQPEEVVRGWDTLAERMAEDDAEDAASGETGEIDMAEKHSPFFKRLMASKKQAKKLDSIQDPNSMMPTPSPTPTASMAAKLPVAKSLDDDEATMMSGLPKKKGTQPNAAKVAGAPAAAAPGGLVSAAAYAAPEPTANTIKQPTVSPSRP
jgi:hypothetical protein